MKKNLGRMFFVQASVLTACMMLTLASDAQTDTIPGTDPTLVQDLPELFITATRIPKNPEEVPARLGAITSAVMEVQPDLTTDEMLDLIPGMNIDRPQGIFSKNASITMRGLNGSPRVLVLIDGVPISKTDGGGVNWNRMVPENTDRIEVIKGPVSTVYGGNAMGGVINVISREPAEKIEGEVKGFYGTYNTFGGMARLGGRLKPTGNSFYYGLYGFYRKGEGYVIVPEETRDSMDARTYMWELSTGVKAGYHYGRGSYTEAEYTYYNDKRGDGTQIYEEDGGYNRYPTDYLRITSNNNFGKYTWIVRYFYQNEHYLRQSETMSVKKGSKYTLYDTDAQRIDHGIWTNLNFHVKHNMELAFGLDLKQGSVNGDDIYYTSTDILHNQGKMNFLALFAEYEWQPMQKKFSILAGLRYDVARFFDGGFTIEEPTTLTEFMTAFPSEYEDQTWDEWSPKLGIRYRFNDMIHAYVSYAHGFRPGMLDDMCRNGNISKGFKLANPRLQPESVDNFEVGADWKPIPAISVQPSLYCTLGNDFHYFVGNGDSISTGGDNLKPILQRQNVSRVRVLGAEVTFTWQIIRQISLTANYAFNDSRITAFDNTGYESKDLTGKYLMEVPKNQAFAGIYYSSRILQASLVFNYKAPQYSDDENTQQTPAYSTFDMRIGKTFLQKLTASLVIQDIFNTRYYDSKGYLSPGRFLMLNLSYRFAHTPISPTQQTQQ